MLNVEFLLLGLLCIVQKFKVYSKGYLCKAVFSLDQMI